MEMNRRSFIIGVPVSAAVVAAPAVAVALTQRSRMAELFADWERAAHAVRVLPEETPYAEWRPVAEAARVARAAIVQEPARTAEDLYMKLVVAASAAGGVEGIEEALDEDISTGNAFDTTLAMSALLDLVNGVEGLPPVVPVALG